MLNKKEIKDIQSLSHKKFREALKLFVAEGPKVVAELLELMPERVEKLYAVSSWFTANKGLADPSKLVPVSEAELERISQLQTPNQVLALLKQKEAVVPPDVSFTLYLDTIQDPGNFGTIIRIADWFGIGHVVCTPGCADLYNAKVVQSTMASIGRVNVYYDEQGTWLPGQRRRVYAATLEGNSLYRQEKTGEGILIIGNESKGISPALLQGATERVAIPRKGAAESLNAAVAAGIILSHLLN